jgi:hypothetical protein
MARAVGTRTPARESPTAAVESIVRRIPGMETHRMAGHSAPLSVWAARVGGESLFRAEQPVKACCQSVKNRCGPHARDASCLPWIVLRPIAFACHLPNERRSLRRHPGPASVLARGRSVHVTETPFDQRWGSFAVPLDRHDLVSSFPSASWRTQSLTLAGICSRPTGTGGSLTGDARARLTTLAANVLLRKPSETLFGTFPVRRR